MNKYEFSKVVTEQVSKYHPDKFADQISDKIVDYILKKNRNAKTGVECLIKDTTVVLGGEVSGYNITNHELILLVAEVAKSLNYKVTKVINLIGSQSTEIKNAVEINDDTIGAGDQGFVYGFATRDTPDYLPLGTYVANKIIRAIEDVVGMGVLKGDAKTLVLDDNGKITKILVSVCHVGGYDLTDITVYMTSIINNVLKDIGLDYKPQLLINPAGIWLNGGASADAGLTGRKIVADQYGGYIHVGGGAFSGKDLTKVDRSGAYMARLVAIELLNKYPDIDWVKLQIGYAIGEPRPFSLVAYSNKGDISHLVDRSKFDVKCLVDTFKDYDLYELSKGSHFRDLIIGSKNK